MGMFTDLMKKAKLYDDGSEKSAAQKKKEAEEAAARTAARAKKLKDAPLNRFQREADKLKLNK